MEASDVRESGSESEDWAIVDEDSSHGVSGDSKYVFRGDISDAASNRAAGDISDGESIEIVPDDRDVDTMEVVPEDDELEQSANGDRVQAVVEDGTVFAENLSQEEEAGPSSVLTNVESRHRARLSERDHWDLVAILMVALVGGFAVGYYCGSAGFVRKPGVVGAGDVVQSLRAEVHSLRASLLAFQSTPESASTEPTTASIDQLYQEFSSFQCRWQNECLREKNGAFCLARKNRPKAQHSQENEASDDFILIGKKSDLSDPTSLPELRVDVQLNGGEVAPLPDRSVDELSFPYAKAAGALGTPQEDQVLAIENLQVSLGAFKPLSPQEDSSLENRIRPDFILKPDEDYGFVYTDEETSPDFMQANGLKSFISAQEEMNPDFNQINDPEYFISKQEGIRPSFNRTHDSEDLSTPKPNQRISSFTLKPDDQSELTAQLRRLTRLADRLAPGTSLSALAAVEAGTRTLGSDPRLARFESRAAQKTAKLAQKLESFERRLVEKAAKRLERVQKEIVEKFCKVRSDLREGVNTNAFPVCINVGKKGKGGRNEGGETRDFQKPAGGEEIDQQKNKEWKAFQDQKIRKQKRKEDIKRMNEEIDSKKQSAKYEKMDKNWKTGNKKEDKKLSTEEKIDSKKESSKYEKIGKNLKKEARKEEKKVSTKEKFGDTDSSNFDQLDKHLKKESRKEPKSVDKIDEKKESAKSVENNKPWKKENEKNKSYQHDKKDQRFKKENEHSEKRLADKETDTKKSSKTVEKEKLRKNEDRYVKKNADNVNEGEDRCEKDARKGRQGETEPCPAKTKAAKRSDKPKGDSGLRHEACDGRKPENVSWVIEMGRGRQALRSTASQSDWVFDRAAARESHRSDKPAAPRRKWTDRIFPERVLAAGRKVKEAFQEMHKGIKKRAHKWR